MTNDDKHLVPDESVAELALLISQRDYPSYDVDLPFARKVLEAVAPQIAARALDDAADAFDDLPMDRGAIRIVPGTWEYFEIFPTQHMRDRAEALRAAHE